MLRDEVLLVLLVLLVFLVLLVLLLMLRDEVSAESEMSTSALSSRFRPNQSLSSLQAKPMLQQNTKTHKRERELRQVVKNFVFRLKSGKKTEWQSVRSPKN